MVFEEHRDRASPALPSSRLALLTCYAETGWYILWDPTQPTATRPLAIRKDGAWYAYGWDLIRLRVSLCSLATPRQAKNICEIYGQTGYIRTLYTYSPYGAVSADGDVTQTSDENVDIIFEIARTYSSIETLSEWRAYPSSKLVEQSCPMVKGLGIEPGEGEYDLGYGSKDYPLGGKDYTGNLGGTGTNLSDYVRKKY